jgi:hypothetical protein
VKIYKTLVMDIKSGKTIFEDSYIYDGPIAECKGGSSTEYVQSPEAREIMEMMMPTVQRIAEAGQLGGTLWDIPSYGLPASYAIPDITSMMPTTATMAAISPDVKAAVMAPYKETEQQLLETLGAGGGLGSARGGFSGQGAAGVGRYWADVAPEYTQSLWGMVAPAQQAGWQAELNRALTGYGAELGRSKDIWSQQVQAAQFPYTVIPQMAGAAMPTPVTTSGKK